jgi:Xaa-Pro dipeptidase
VEELKAEEEVRVERLLDAQEKAAQLFDEIERRGMIRPGVTEQELSGDIHDLAAEMLGVTRHWHRRIVRAGENTLQPFRERPPDRVIAEDDIVFLDLGPIFEEWEADFGRTFVLGDDPQKKAVCDALPRVWQAGHDHFAERPDVTGAELFEYVVGVARAEGFEWGSHIAGYRGGVLAQEDRRYRDRVVHHARIGQADAAHGPNRPPLSLDPGNPSGRSRPRLRRFLRAAARSALNGLRIVDGLLALDIGEC